MPAPTPCCGISYRCHLTPSVYIAFCRWDFGLLKKIISLNSSMWSFKIDMYITHDDNHGLLILFFLQSKKKKNKKIKKKKSFEDVQEEKHSGSESVEDGKKKKKKKKVKKQKFSAESPTNSGSNLQVKGKKGRKIDGKIISASKVVDVGQMGLEEGGKSLKKKPAKKRKHETGEKKPLSLGTSINGFTRVSI